MDVLGQYQETSVPVNNNVMAATQASSTQDQPDHGTSSTYIVEPLAPHTHTLILLHGLGSHGEKFGKEFLETATTSQGQTLPQLLPGARFVFPTAKRRRSSAFKRAVINQWFDIARLTDPEYRKETQLQGLEESAGQIGVLLRDEISEKKIPPRNIVIGGISNGCAMALSVLLALDHPLGGFVGMCGYLPFQKDILDATKDKEEDEDEDEDDPFAADSNEETDQETQDPSVKALVFERELLCLPPLTQLAKEKTACSTPVFLGHGDADEKKPYALGEAAAVTMRAAGYQVAWKLYEGLGHWYKVPDEIDDIVDFLQTQVGWELSK